MRGPMIARIHVPPTPASTAVGGEERLSTRDHAAVVQHHVSSRSNRWGGEKLNFEEKEFMVRAFRKLRINSDALPKNKEIRGIISDGVAQKKLANGCDIQGVRNFFRQFVSILEANDR